MADNNANPERKFLMPTRQFLQVYRHAIELEAQLPENMSDYEWFTKGKLTRTLIVDLRRAGEAAGILMPYGRYVGENTVEFGVEVNPTSDLDGVVDLNAASHWDYDTYTGASLLSLATHVMGEQPAPTAAVLNGGDAIFEIWEYVDWLKPHRPAKKEIADRAYKTFIDCAVKAGLVRVNWNELPDLREGVGWEQASLILPPEFWTDYLLLRMPTH